MKNSANSRLNLPALCELIRKETVLSTESMTEVLKKVDWQEILSDAQPFIQFDPDTYKRNLVLDLPHAQVLILCWRPGQGSKVHDHGSSNCGLVVLAGQATETVYSSVSGMPLAIDERTASSMTVVPGSFVHKVENLHHEDLITLHIYSPPLVRITN
jgi:cysteine dioxygenase